MYRELRKIIRYGFEWKTRRTLFGFPLVCVSFGRDEKGNTRVAKGIVAVGQFAIGVIAVAQVGVGFLFSFGQAVFGLVTLGQLAIGFLAVGQIAVGYLALGLAGLGVYVMAETGYGTFLWSGARQDMEVLSIFYTIKMILTGDLDLASKVGTWFFETLSDLFSLSPE